METMDWVAVYVGAATLFGFALGVVVGWVCGVQAEAARQRVVEFEDGTVRIRRVK